MTRQASYHERLLHWIWENAHFERRHLYTVSGRKIQIRQPGCHNKTDGPDFYGAEIMVGNLRWYGNIEIHWKLSDWHSHAHDRNPRYNSVILHVVFEETDEVVQREDQSAVPTLWLGQYLSKPLKSFLPRYLEQPQLPCHRHLSFISEEAFLRQLDKAHREYFEQKIDDLSVFYDPALSPSRAWLKLLSVAFFDGLGIAHNRDPMRELCRQLFNQIGSCSSADAFRQHALRVSGIGSSSRKTSIGPWNHKGCRPANHPEYRIQQAALGLWHIYHLPFAQWMETEPHLLWDDLVNSIDTVPRPGKERASILFGTVFLPALYILGNLFYNKTLKQQSFRLWQDHRVSLPESLLDALHKTGLDGTSYNKKLGTIHQLHSYCKPGKCQKCNVFKKAITS